MLILVYLIFYPPGLAIVDPSIGPVDRSMRQYGCGG